MNPTRSANPSDEAERRENRLVSIERLDAGDETRTIEFAFVKMPWQNSAGALNPLMLAVANATSPPLFDSLNPRASYILFNLSSKTLKYYTVRHTIDTVIHEVLHHALCAIGEPGASYLFDCLFHFYPTWLKQIHDAAMEDGMPPALLRLIETGLKKSDVPPKYVKSIEKMKTLAAIAEWLFVLKSGIPMAAHRTPPHRAG